MSALRLAVSTALILVLVVIDGTQADANDAQTPSWDQLASSLSNPSDFQISQSNDWIDQCVEPFADKATPTGLSNYQLFMKPSGLCTAHLSCSYEECNGPFPKDGENIGKSTYDQSSYTDEMFISDDKLNLPDGVVHPKHVGDISEAIKFAAQHKIGVSVKTSGHSYTGSSTKKGTILLNLSKLQKYSPDGSIVECDTDNTNTANIPQGAYEDACKLAIARDKPAVVRVGGGEIFDELLRAVSITWNENENNTRKYHVVTGGAGTVSAAGGWLASGGLSGNNGMRLYGLGVDQVLHVEMVLPSGVHVRFGPTEWVEDTDKMYPTTTKVTGYCNLGVLSDEASWDWQMCMGEDANINFNDLWYAVRGGGGGTYGVITSIYYQLHDIPNSMQAVIIDIPGVLAYLGSIDGDLKIPFLAEWIEFILKFFFDPHSIGVSESASNSCSSPDAGGFLGGFFVCHNGAGSIMKTAWEIFLNNQSADDYFYIIETKSWAHYVVDAAKANPSIPDGRADDSPKPMLFPSFWSFCIGSYCIANQYMMFPIEAIVTKMDTLVPMILQCIIEPISPGFNVCGSNMYIMGGMIPSADDGMNSLPLHRRHGGFLMIVRTLDVRASFDRVFYNITNTSVDDHNNDADEIEVVVDVAKASSLGSGIDNFPGGLCHNHASADYPTPQKEDWTKPCDFAWSKEEREEKCFSYQETAWGTIILKELERIHRDVDPNHLFQCWDCAGYADDDIDNNNDNDSDNNTTTMDDTEKDDQDEDEDEDEVVDPNDGENDGGDPQSEAPFWWKSRKMTFVCLLCCWMVLLF